MIDPNLPKVYLRPGEVHFATTPTVVMTILGSCVSVTMFDRLSGTAAICHALLPEGPHSDAFRYVDSSILGMLELFDARGVPRRQLEVKLFGGADMIGAGGSRVSVGRRNIEIASEVLAQEGVTVASRDVGGSGGRKLFFVTSTGEVFLKRLRQGEAVAP